MDSNLLDELYRMGVQYDTGSETSPFGQIGHASTPFGEHYFGTTSFFGPRLVQTPYGDVFYGSSALSDANKPLFGQAAIDAKKDAGKERAVTVVSAPPPPAETVAAVAAPPAQLPYWMQMPPGWGELGSGWGGSGGGGSGGGGSGGGDSGR